VTSALTSTRFQLSDADLGEYTAAKTSTESSTPLKYCTMCGSPIKKKKYCEACGAKVGSSSLPSTPVVASEPIAGGAHAQTDQSQPGHPIQTNFKACPEQAVPSFIPRSEPRTPTASKNQQTIFLVIAAGIVALIFLLVGGVTIQADRGSPPTGDWAKEYDQIMRDVPGLSPSQAQQQLEDAQNMGLDPSNSGGAGLPATQVPAWAYVLIILGILLLVGTIVYCVHIKIWHLGSNSP
jgi:hypothetical protein